MFTLVLNNGEEFKLTLWDGQNFELKTDGLVSRAKLEPIPCTLVFETGTATGYLYVYGISEDTTLELLSCTVSGHMVKWGNGTEVWELVTPSDITGDMTIADQSQWHCIYELLSEAALSTVVTPIYVGENINETTSALGDITIAEYCWKEVVE